VADAGAGSYTTETTDFSLVVQAPADTTAPVVTPNVTGTLGANGWYTSNVNLSWSVTDDQSTVTSSSGCGPVSQTIDTTGTTYTCSATSAGGTGSNSVIIKRDTIAPTITPTGITQAPNANGWYTSVPVTANWSCSDATSGATTPGASVSLNTEGSNLSAIGTCADYAGLAATNTVSGIKIDLANPTLTLPTVANTEATGPGGAAVSFTISATDSVDVNVAVSCDADSGDTFEVGTTPVTCTATDDAGRQVTDTFTVTVVDTTAPDLTVPADITNVEATGPAGATVIFSASASDLVDGPVSPSCASAAGLVSSGDTFALGTTTVTCSATDAAGNPGTKTFTVTVVDTTAPALTVPADITVEPTSAAGATVTFSVSATDLVSGTRTVTCNPPSGSTFAIGTTTVTCSAKDAAGNPGTKTFTVTVKPLTITGFSQPVDMNGVFNTVKGGSTVPLKFEIFAGTGLSAIELTDTSMVRFTVTKVNCTTGVTDEIETLATTGGTTLRHDGGQYIQNWKTPTGTACYQVAVFTVAADGTTKTSTPIVAFFKTR
jgi:hypothetical protein